MTLQVGQRVRLTDAAMAAGVTVYKAYTGRVQEVREDTVYVLVDFHRSARWFAAADWEPLMPERDPHA